MAKPRRIWNDDPAAFVAEVRNFINLGYVVEDIWSQTYWQWCMLRRRYFALVVKPDPPTTNLQIQVGPEEDQ